MKRFRKVLAVLLAVIMLMLMIPVATVTVGAIIQSEFDSRLNTLRSQYPNYSTWYDSFDGGTQCFGFARLVAYNVFGSHVRDWGISYSIDGVKAGDVLQYGNTSGSGHTIFVISVSGDSITFADCNGNGNRNSQGNYVAGLCMVKWDNYTTISANSLFGYGFSYRHISPNIDPDPDPIPKGHVMSESEGAGRTIPDGDYWIISKIAEDYFVDIPGNDFNTNDKQNVQTWRWDSGLPPKYDVFNFTYLNNGFYKITQLNTNMAIDVYGADLKRGSNVSMWTYNGTLAQQWSIEKTSGGYRLRSRCNNYYMDITDGKHDSGTNILVWESLDGNNQRFSFIPYAPDEKPLSNGIYEIRSAVNQNAFLDAIGIPSDYKDPTNVDIWNGADGEKFQIEYAGNGYYFISEVVSGLVLDLNNDGEYSFLKDGKM